MIMPPSPALRSSPRKELRASNHKRGHSFESSMLIRENDEDLALFNEMQTREKESFLLHSAEDLEDSFSTTLRHFSDLKLGISIPARGENSNSLNTDGKNDYDWLLTPPDTPLFPSLDDEPPVTTASRGRTRSQPIAISRSPTMEKSRRSSTSRGSASPNRLSPSPRSANSVSQMRGWSSSAPNSSPTSSLRHATPSRRPTTPTRRSSPPPSTPSTSILQSSTSTPRRMSTGSSGTIITSRVRGSSPIKTVRGNSASPKIRAWQTNIPGFSSDAPPNLRTSLGDRPTSYVRGSSPASRNSRDLSYKYNRQSMSPTASRSISSSHSHDRDRYSSYSKGSIASSGDDDLDSLPSIPASSLDNSSSKGWGTFSNNKALAFSKKSTRIVSTSAPKRSFDSTTRQMDRIGPNMFRPLLSSVPSTSLYTGKANSAHRSLISKNSSVTTSSNASSDHGTSVAHDTEGSDHKHDDMASECEKVPYSDNHEEVFSFDKIDIVNENYVDDIKSLRSGPACGCDTIVTEDNGRQSILPELSSTPYSSLSMGGSSEVFCHEDTFLCSKCGRRYNVINIEEPNVNICPECCSKEENFLSIVHLESRTAVTESLTVLSSKEYEADKVCDKNESLVIFSESSLDTDGCESRISESVDNIEQDKETYPEQSQSYLKESFPSETPVDEGQHCLVNHLEMSQSDGSGIPPNTESGNQPPLHHNDFQTLRFDASEGAGISILLKRSNSSKGPVIQGRTFTASTMSYDDLSFARDSMSSMRSSIGHNSFSASSSADFSSARQIEARMQRQVSSRKVDTENKKCDVSMKLNSETTSFGMPTVDHPDFGFATTTQEENLDDFLGIIENPNQVTTLSTQKTEVASENVELDDTSSTSSAAIVEEDKFECNTCRTPDASTSESSREDLSGCRSISDREVVATTLECSVVEGHNMSGCNVIENDASGVPAHSLTMISETETQKLGEVITPDSHDEESMETNASDQQEFTPVYNREKSDVILEESTVIVDCQGRTKARSLTLEEATDTILFCSSIVQNLAYSAATIAIEKERQVTIDDSRLMVTILGKSNTDRSDLRNRIGVKRAVKSHKPRQRRVEMTTTPPFSKTENDENTDESAIPIVGLPNQRDSMKPPKLESKCNCSIL